MVSTTQRQLRTFYLLSIALSWPAMLLWRLPDTFIVGDVDAARAAYAQVGLFFGFGPMIAALIVAFGFGGIAGLGERFGRLSIVRFSPAWYVAALGLPIAGQWVGTLVWGAVRGEAVSAPHLELMSLVTLLIAQSFFSLGEELGWRGFMLPRVLMQRTWLESALVIGGLWAVWHYPLWIAVNYAITGSIWETFAILVLASGIGMAFSVMITLIFTRTRGSLLPPLLFHGAANLNMNLIYEGMRPDALSSMSLLLATTAAALALSTLVVIAVRPGIVERLDAKALR